MASTTAAKAAQAVQRVVPVHKKYTLQSLGVWETIRRIFAVDPTRSNGIPLNPQFRNPPPGANEPFSFIDPVTLPAADIAENPYYKRDVRRAYPKLAVVGQRDLGALLTLGSEASPRRELIGEEGTRELERVRDGEGDAKEAGLARAVKEHGAKSLVDERGLPPMPVSLGDFTEKKAGNYRMTEEQGFPEKYPCRTFE